MSYLPARFPLVVAARPVGGPGFSTRIATTVSAFEQRNANWEASRWSGDAAIGIRSEAHFQLVRDHFHMARGRLHHFRFKDYADYTVERSAGVLVELTSTTFQIYKQYGTEAGFEDYRKITRPVADTLSVWKNSVLQTLTTHYTLAAETGIVTFTSPPGVATLECACEFDVPVRYDTDQLLSTLVVPGNGARSAHHAWEQVPLVEHRE